MAVTNTGMDRLELEVHGETYAGPLLVDEAPQSVEALREFLPLSTTLMHVRWSGYAVWTNIDEIDLPDLPRENHTVYPSRGDVLLYPGYRNEQELLFACGPTRFSSPAGDLAGNHIATLDSTREELAALEQATLDDGAMDATVRII